MPGHLRARYQMIEQEPARTPEDQKFKTFGLLAVCALIEFQDDVTRIADALESLAEKQGDV